MKISLRITDRGPRIFLTLAALILVVVNLDAVRFAHSLAEVSWIWLALAALAFGVEMWISAWKTAWLLGAPSGWPLQFRVNCVKVFVNQIVPGGIGGEAARLLWIGREAGVGRAAAIVLLDRLGGFYAQLAATFISLGVLLGYSARVTLRVLAVGAALGVIGTFLLPFLFRRVMPALARQARRWGGGDFPDEGGADEFEAAWRETMAAGGRFTLMLSLSLAMQGSLIFLLMAASRAVGVEVTAWQASPIMLLATFSTLAPLTIGNLGVTEGAFALGFVFFGHRPEGGVAASLALRSVLLPAAVYGGWLAARRRR